MIVVLWIVVVLTGLVVARFFSNKVLVLVATAGLLAYSVPALLGLHVTVSIGRQRPVIADTSSESILAMAIAWVGYLLVLCITALRNNPRYIQGDRTSITSAHGVDDLALSAAALSVVLLLFMMISHGPLFFLEQRHVLAKVLGFEYMIWRWISLLGLLFAMRAKGKGEMLILAAMIFLNMIVGDRTVIVLTIAAAFCINYRSSGFFEIVRRPVSWVYGASVILIIFFAKTFYLSVKNGSPLSNAFSTTRDQNILSYEPFGTHYILDRVIAYDIQTSSLGLLKGFAGQLLIIPSAFGIDSAAFNVHLTQELFNSRLTYGIAANFWAQGYALAGYWGVLSFGMLFGALILACQWVYQTKGATLQIFVASVAVLAGVYIHRNSAENFLSFVRQLALSLLLIVVVASFVRAMKRRGVAPRHSRP